MHRKSLHNCLIKKSLQTLQKANRIIIFSLILTILLGILPSFLRTYPQTYENLFENATLNLAPFDYFYASKEKIVGNWSYRIDSLEQGMEKRYYDPSYNSDSWDRITVPFLYKAIESNSSMWTRVSFKIPEAMKKQRLRLVFQGVWGISKIWLNGIYLGEHYGYFSPFFFDIDGIVNLDGLNMLTLHIETPVLPYPYDSRVYPAGPYAFSEVFPDMNYSLIGIWREVMLVGTREVTINLVLIDVKKYSNPALLSFRSLIQNKGDNDISFSAVLKIKRLGSVNTTVIVKSLDLTLRSEERRWESFEISIPDPAFWFSWDVGTPNLYLAEISLYHDEVYSGSIQTLFGIRSLEVSFSRSRRYFKINGANIFLRGGAYFTKYYPLVDFYDDINMTLRLLKDANVNFLRAFAHVAPKEFYEITSMMGIAVQADFPLLGSYPSLDYSQYYSDLIKKQVIELVLLTYNYPSVVIIYPHSFPGWINEKSPYYGSRVNYYFDSELEELIRSTKTEGVLIYSGRYEKYFNYGWGTDNWMRYSSYRELLPTIIVPESLSCLDSPFWNRLPQLSYGETFQWLEDNGLDLKLSEEYWLNTATNISSLIEISQKYQSLVTRLAIDRARVLKGSASIGISLFPISDYLPKITGSIIDYYSFIKKAYLDVRNAFNPIHTVILFDGDYRKSLTSICFHSNSTVKINLWIVNDAFQEERDAVLKWSIIDKSSGKVLFNEEIALKLPSSSSNAKLVRRYSFEAKERVDTERVFEVLTELNLPNGTKLDSNSQIFVIKPLSYLKISLNPKPIQSQYFLLLTEDDFRIVKVLNETIIPAPSEAKVTLIGPSFNEKDIYVPQIISLKELSGGMTNNLEISLHPGALAKVLAIIPSLDSSMSTTREFYIDIFGEKASNLLLEYTSDKTTILNLLNITGNMIIVPAEENLSIIVSISSKLGKNIIRIGNETHPINLPRNSISYFDQPAIVQVKLNQPIVNKAIVSAESVIKEARKEGFYVGLESYKLNQIKELNEKASKISDPLIILAYQQEIIATSKTIIDNVSNTRKEAGINQVLILVIVIPLAIVIGSLFIEKKKHLVTSTLISFIVLMAIAYQIFPVSSIFSSQSLLAGVLTLLVVSAIFFIIPRLLRNTKSDWGVLIIPAITVAVSYSIGNLRKRKSRTILVLSSIVMMTVAIAALTSIRIHMGTNSFLLLKTWPDDKPSYSIISRFQGNLNYEDLCFISAQKEVLKIGCRVVSPTTYRELGYIEGVPIYGILGIFGESPSFNQLREIIYPKEAWEEILTTDNSIIISNYLANLADIDIGSVIVFRDIKLKVVGIFDEDSISNVKEPNGGDFLPLYFPSMMASATPVPGNYLIITNMHVAQKLGCHISTIYCIFNDNSQAKEVSERLSRLGNYFVVTMPSSERIRYYFTGVSMEVFGSTVLIPIVIAMLNIALVFYMVVYEREKEIFNLSSIGLNPIHISFLFLTEAAVIGFIGCGIGYISSLLFFRILNFLDIIVPVNIKSSVFDMVYLVIITITTAVISSSIPALKAAKIATPSLSRRWKMEEKVVREGVWIVKLPLKIPIGRAKMFADYLYNKLSEGTMLLESRISNVNREENIDEYGNTVYCIRFKYGKAGDRPFNAYNMIEIKREDKNYTAFVHSKVESIYQQMEEENVHEVVTYVRRLVLEWSATIN